MFVSLAKYCLFMMFVDVLLGDLDDIDEYNGFAYSSFNGPVSGDVEPIYFTDPYSPGQTLVDYVAKPDYKFAYGVSDPDTGNSQKHQESRDGNAVRGEYSLIEPDGYIRRVIYTSDPTHGFQATVIYEPPSGAISSGSQNSFARFQSSPSQKNFPYEDIMNSIPDFHDINIPHYESAETSQNYGNVDFQSNVPESTDRVLSHDEQEAPVGTSDDIYAERNAVTSQVYESENLVKPKFYEDTNSIGNNVI